jgi:aquaporin Z
METITDERRGALGITEPKPNAFLAALATHWPEYLMEAAGIGIFMISACVFTVLLEHPMSPIQQWLEHPLVRRLLAGIVMGLTAIGIVYSPWGQRSGAHLNPSVTVSFLALGKIAPWDAFFYIAAQFAGGLGGVMLSELVIGFPLKHSAVNYAVTTPGPAGPAIAFAAELLISGFLMTTVLVISNTRKLSRYTGLIVGALIATYITLEAPLSGMSMNPARTFGSALPAWEWNAIWIYFTAPLLGMLMASQMYRFRLGAHAVFCAKLNHHNRARCIFRCRFAELQTRGQRSAFSKI